MMIEKIKIYRIIFEIQFIFFQIIVFLIDLKLKEWNIIRITNKFHHPQLQ